MNQLMTYAKAFEIAQVVVRENKGRRAYRRGVERAAALAAIKQPSREAFLHSMSETFRKYEKARP